MSTVHILEIEYRFAENGNDCDSERVVCSCGLVSYAQEGGGVWQYDRDKQVGHLLDPAHRKLYQESGQGSRAIHWQTPERSKLD